MSSPSPETKKSSSKRSSNSSKQQPASKLATKTLALLAAVLAITLAAFTPLRQTLSNTLTKTLSNTSIRKMSTSATTTSSPQNLKLTYRPSASRGHANHGWLHTHHTFSFASYYSRDPYHQSFGPLRVMNEDRVAPGRGFGEHGHAEFMIWSYIVSGRLRHNDSLGNTEILARGDVQFTSAGTGVRHSEYNGDENPKAGEEVHFLQIWAKPSVRGLKPEYITKTFTDAQKKDALVRIVESKDRSAGGSKGAIPATNDLTMLASILSPGKSVTHDFVADGPRKIYIHNIQTSGRQQPKEGGAEIKVGDKVLKEGDGVYVEGATGPGSLTIESVGGKEAEFLVFDMQVNDA